MAVLKVSESQVSDFDLISEGLFLDAQVEDVEIKESPFFIDEKDPSKGKKSQVSFKFRILDSEYENRVLWGNTPTTFTDHPDCKLRVWVQEILGTNDLPVGYEVDTDHLVGQAVRVVVGVRKGKHADGSDKFTNFVSDVIRLKARVSNPF